MRETGEAFQRRESNKSGPAVRGCISFVYVHSDYYSINGISFSR